MTGIDRASSQFVTTPIITPATRQPPHGPWHLHLLPTPQQLPPPLLIPRPTLPAPPPAARRERDKASNSRSSIRSRCRKQSSWDRRRVRRRCLLSDQV